LFLIHFHTPFLKPEKVQQIAVPLDPLTSNHHNKPISLEQGAGDVILFIYL
jgi:hypothetical protein